MRVFLGVDGGGTSTELGLVTDTGEVLATHSAPTCYYPGSSEGVELVRRVLAEAVETVSGRADLAPATFDFAFFGLPGYGESSADLGALDAAPRTVLGHDRYVCDNDMVCGWAGSLGLVDGINVVSGTGSIAYARRGEVSARVGGWGEVFGDEGSGYWIAVRALQTAARMSDGRLPAGPLLPLLRERLELSTDLDLVDVVLNRWHSDRTSVAALSRVAVDAARRGDDAAARILTEAGAELAGHVMTARTRVGFTATERVRVSYSGGVFAATEVREALADALGGAGSTYELSAPRFSPIIGAALYAAHLSGQALDDAALARLDQWARARS